MLAVCKARRSAAGLLCSLLCLAPLAADANASASFQVAVRIAQASQGICVSESLSELTHAMFLVTCTSGHFVNMSPHPGRPFMGTHGSAFQYHLTRGDSGARRSVPDTSAAQAESLPEVTAMRVSSDRAARDEHVEILISF